MSKLISYLDNIVAHLSSSTMNSSAPEADEFPTTYAFFQGFKRCQSDHERSVFVANHVKYLKWRLSNAETTEVQKCEILKRCLICKALGEDVAFAGFHAISLACNTSSAWDSKVISFNTCQQLVTPQSELSLLMVSTLQHCLVQPLSLVSAAEKCMALTTIATTLSRQQLTLIENAVIESLKSSDKFVRRKSVLVYYKLISDSSQHVEEKLSYLRASLLDKDPGVMMASLQVYDSLPSSCIKSSSNLLNPFIFILDQVVNGNLPKGFVRGGVCGPHIISKLVQLLCKLDTEQADTKQKVQLALLAVVEKYETVNTLPAVFVVSECFKAIPRMSTDGRHFSRIAKYAANLLKSALANYTHTGLCILTELLKYDKGVVKSNRDLIMSALKLSDLTNSEKAMALIIKLTTPSNIEAICELCAKITRPIENTALFQKQTMDIITSCKLSELNIQWFAQKLVDVLCISPGDVCDKSTTYTSATLLNSVLKYLSMPDVAESVESLAVVLKEQLSAKACMQVGTVIMWLHISHPDKLKNCDEEIVSMSVQMNEVLAHHLLLFLSAVRTLLNEKLLTLSHDTLKSIKKLVERNSAFSACSHYLHDIEAIRSSVDSPKMSISPSATSDEFWTNLKSYTEQQVLSKSCRQTTVHNPKPSFGHANPTLVNDDAMNFSNVPTVWTAQGRVNLDQTTDNTCEGKDDQTTGADDSEMAPTEFHIEDDDCTTDEIASKIFSSE